MLLESKLPTEIAAKSPPSLHQRRGSFLIETTVSLFVLVAISIVLMSASFNILQPRTWTMKTNLVDAYLSQEVALMNNLDFDDIAAGTDTSGVTTGWGTGASSTAALANAVVLNGTPMGRMPGFTAGPSNGRVYNANVYRVRIIPQVNGATIVNSTAVADFEQSSTGQALSLADTGVNCYELQTHVVYTVGNNTYVKTRSVIRSQ